MEGARQWAFTGPAFAIRGAEQGAQGLAADAQYFPADWKKRRRRGKKHGGGKRRKGQGGATHGLTKLAPPPTAVAATPTNPAQLTPLRCTWPHPAVVELVVQQCWPAAGAAVLAHPAAAAILAAPQLGHHQPNWWNCMLPSLSLLHTPLSLEQQELVGGSPGSSSNGGSSSGTQAHAAPLPRPHVLVGYEDDWLEVAAEVLPLWHATPLAPFAGPKRLLHYLVCTTQQLPQSHQFIKDVGSLFETCNLGSHQPATSSPVHAFQLQVPPGSTLGGEGGCAATTGDLPAAAWYLAGLRQACEQLQCQLLLDPPAELQQQGTSLECGCEPAVVVYVACPLEQQQEQVAVLLEVASCLAPCTPLGLEASLALLPHTGSGLDLACSEQQALAPSEPMAADHPAGTTPAADGSRAPGGSPPPGEAQEEGNLQQGGEQGRYHGAAEVLHQQQHGDFRQLPLRMAQRPQGSRPLNIVLQVLTPQALADISGTATRCTALALYSKMRHILKPSHQQLAVAALGVEEASLPFCSQPLMVLAVAAASPARQDVQQPTVALDGQQQDQQPQQESEQLQAVDANGTEGQPGMPSCTLHCFYVLPPPGASLLPLAFADSCGELLHSEVLDLAAASISSLSSSDSLLNTAASTSCSSAGRACHLVLRRGLELLCTLRASSNPPSMLRSLAIAGRSMGQEERLVWQQLLEHDPGLQLELPYGGEVAVLELQALLPARYAGPEPPAGGNLLLQHGDHEGGRPRASMAWLPPAHGASSLLPQEHDTVRMLQLALVARCQSDEATAMQRNEADSLRNLASELHGLAWLHAAFQGACLRTPAGGGQAACADAHMPVHAAMAEHLHALLMVALNAQLLA